MILSWSETEELQHSYIECAALHFYPFHYSTCLEIVIVTTPELAVIPSGDVIYYITLTSFSIVDLVDAVVFFGRTHRFNLAVFDFIHQ